MALQCGADSIMMLEKLLDGLIGEGDEAVEVMSKIICHLLMRKSYFDVITNRQSEKDVVAIVELLLSKLSL